MSETPVMKWGAAIGTLFGLAVAAWLLASFGIEEIMGLVAKAGWGLVVVVLFHWSQILFSAIAWRTLGGSMVSLWDYVVLRWIREGVNNLLPVAQVGGQVVGVRLLRRRGVPMPDAVAGSVGDWTTEILTQILFTLIGLGLLLALVGVNRVALYVLLGSVVATIAAVGLVAGQWFGLAGRTMALVQRLSARFGGTLSDDLTGVDERVRALYRAPGPVFVACFHHSLSWLLGGVEVCLTLHLLGHPVSFAEGLVIESLGQGIKAAGFAIPGAIGVAEGGFVIIGAMFGLGPEVSIALGLIKRLREVLLGLPALVAWHWEERRPAAMSTATGRG